jgi:hypothetical protein
MATTQRIAEAIIHAACCVHGRVDITKISLPAAHTYATHLHTRTSCVPAHPTPPW